MKSTKITSELTAYDIMEDNKKKLKTEIKRAIEEKYKNVIERLKTEINDKEKCLVDIPTLTGVSNWLTVLPITESGLKLSKQPFWGSIRLQYGWENMKFTNILSLDSNFDIQQNMSCKKVVLYAYGIINYEIWQQI